MATSSELTYNVECPSTESLSHWIKEDDDQIGSFTQPDDCSVHIKWIFHVPVHKARSVDERQERELLLLTGGNLRAQIVHDP